MSVHRGLSPETDAVFRSAGPSLGASLIARLGAGTVDWRRMLRIAEDEVATAGLWRALKREAPTLVPTEVAEYLAKNTTMSDFRMQHLSGRLQGSVRALAARGVRVLFMKGAAVGAMSDSTFCSRPMNDIDILVHAADVTAASDALRAAGWTFSTSPAIADLLAGHHHLPPFLDPQLPGIRLELHLSSFPPEHPFAIGEEDFWRDAVAATAPFAGASLPSAEHLLFHTCVHFAWSHSMSFGAWRTIRSVAALAQSGQVDWQAFVTLARESKGATACYWTLRLASTLGGVALPAFVLPRLAAPSPEFVRRALERHFITTLVPGEGPACPSVRLSRLLWLAALRPRWSGYRAPGRLDTEQRWGRAMGTFVAEAPSARIVRHLRGLVRWWQFLWGTLIAPVLRRPPGTPTPR